MEDYMGSQVFEVKDSVSGQQTKVFDISNFFIVGYISIMILSVYKTLYLIEKISKQILVNYCENSSFVKIGKPDRRKAKLTPVVVVPYCAIKPIKKLQLHIFHV